MHLDKNIKTISELNDFFIDDEKVGDSFIDILKSFYQGSVNRTLNTIKKKGTLAGDLLAVLILLPFAQISSVRALFLSGMSRFVSGQKDAYYRLKNNSTINWRNLLWLIVNRFEELVSEKGSHSGVKCLILDDSLLVKTSRFTEGVSKVFDHVTGRYLWGYKLLTLGFWDGKSFLPLDFTLHCERSKNKKFPYGMKKTDKQKQYKKQRLNTTAGAKRKHELTTTKIKQAIELIKRAVKQGFLAEYILTDSWFFCHELLKTICQIKQKTVHLIAMAKMSEKHKYVYQGKSYTPGALKQHLKSKKKRCRKLRATYIQCNATYQDIDVKLFFVRYVNQKKWKLMVTTNRQLSFIRMMEIYSIRWSIEVFFKEAKQHLHLGKCQSQDLDAQVADVTIAMIRYVLLSLSKRFSDYETFGRLFEAHSKQAIQYTMAERIWGLVLELIEQLCEVFETTPEQVLEKLLNTEGKQQKKLEMILQRLLELEKENQSLHPKAA
jgi:hypothetical protein